MDIHVTHGAGAGANSLAAFDRALFDAGIANYNLIKLSSVIPANSKIIVEKSEKYNDSEYGNKLYVVMAEKIVDVPGVEAVAGVGWIKHNNDRNSGLFVEFNGFSEDEVSNKIRVTLGSMNSYRPEEASEVQMVISKIKCVDEPVCALVTAVYKSEGWE